MSADVVAPLLFTVSMIALFAAVLVGVRGWAPATRPLGVAVPAARRFDPDIAGHVDAAEARFRRVGALTSIGAVAVCVVLAFTPVAPGLPAIGGLLALAGWALAFALGRRSLLVAKADGRWFEGQPQVRRAEVALEAARASHSSVPVGWYVASVAVLLAAAGYGASLYSRLPDLMPTHWTASGAPDVFSDKSIGSVFGVLLVGLAIIVFVAGLAAVMGRSGRFVDPALPAPRRMRREQILQHVFGVGTLASTVVVAGVAVAGWRAAVGGAYLSPWFVLLVVLPLIALVVAVRNATRLDAPADGADLVDGVVQPDDDRWWKGGLVYANPNDPAVFVPKRIGVGLTLNVASTGGKVFLGIVGLAVAGAILVPVLAGLVGR